MSIDGVVNIYKEKGYTSHDVVAIIRKILRNYYADKEEISEDKGKLKVGHAGTLDPQAEGVLPVCIGKATKISEYISSNHKLYRAVMQLGVVTDTQDMTGKILEKQDVNFKKQEIIKAINSFVGGYWQLPPMFSAIKIDGQKLYDLARKGKEVERDKRLVTIYDIKIKEFLPNDQILMEVYCSKGTYIRALCHDIGQKLGCGASMDQLTRLKAGRFHIIESVKLKEFDKIVEEGNIRQVLCPIDQALQGFHKAYAVSFADNYLRNGNSLSVNYIKFGKRLLPEEEIMIYNSENILIGLYKIVGDGNAKYAKPIKMLI